MFKWILMAAIAFVLVATPATQAADDDKAKVRAGKMFKKLDKDTSGSVSLEEFKALAKGDDEKAKKLEKKFKKLHADGNGSLSLEEFVKGSGKKKGKKKKDADADGDK